VVRVLIADDERLARVGIRRLLAEHPDLEVVGECGDGASTIRAIDSLEPDLVFLDVQMPEGDGFEVIARVGPDRMPAVVFVTAFDEHAIKAFETDAVDYLLKPVDPERLHQAVVRAIRRLRTQPNPGAGAALEALLARLHRSPTSAEPQRIPVEVDGRYHFVDPAEIGWVEAAGNYVRLHTRGRTHRLRGTLDGIHQRLGSRFLRVSRSALVNRDAVDTVEHFIKGTYVLFLRCGAKVKSSRRYRAELTKLLGS
jgi:two-component system LytT family response regulator